ncbi:MAG: hypothetical protein Q8O24_03775 [Gallionellaceae bacterium]|nr:hypothetical protein [Gallionellaceae bacterium]
MKLQTTINSEKAIVFREKWGAIAFLVMMAFFCFIPPAIFYLKITSSQAVLPNTFIALICAALLLLGGAILIRIPQRAKQFLQDDGAIVFIADTAGITLNTILSRDAKHFSWSLVSEIMLADNFKVIDHEKNSFSRHSLILFLPPMAIESWGWLDRLKFGLSKSGRGRNYVACKYPNQKGPEIRSSLIQFAPISMRIKHHQKVIFDSKSCVDIYSEQVI